MEHPKITLGRYGLTPKKSLGQNFLHDDNILARITKAASLARSDQVLEIGPGLGALTRHLADSAGSVVAVELDDRLLPILSQQLDSRPNVEVVHADILELEPPNYLGERYKAVGNVPYYITGAILRHLLSAGPRPGLLVLTVQQEVAERIVAQPGNMSLLSVMVQFYSRAELLFKIKAGAFWPRPEVDSAVVRLAVFPIARLPENEVASFFRLVRAGYSQKRKQLQKSLRALDLHRERLGRAFIDTGIDGRRRAQSLSVDEWLALYRSLL
ncbi:MAG: ribosomal RNA small subunit methyltransferase A [Chloroflexota bacterium]|nr:MAG: ribosomal RNA small subunit methyltransferase A [Chloroflexota bacterium]